MAGRESWLLLRRNLDSSEPKYYLSNAPESIPLLTLGRVGAMRWPIETEFEAEKGERGLDEYEVRSWRGWHHHISLALLAGAFLLTVQQDWGEKMPRLSRPQVSRVVRVLLPQREWTKEALWCWLIDTQQRNQRAQISHAKRRLIRSLKPSL